MKIVIMYTNEVGTEMIEDKKFNKLNKNHYHQTIHLFDHSPCYAIITVDSSSHVKKLFSPGAVIVP